GLPSALRGPGADCRGIATARRGRAGRRPRRRGPSLEPQPRPGGPGRHDPAAPLRAVPLHALPKSVAGNVPRRRVLVAPPRHPFRSALPVVVTRAASDAEGKEYLLEPCR